MMKVIRKILFWVLTIMAAMFIGCWTMSAVSKVHIGESVPSAIADGFVEVADQVAMIVGIGKREPDVILDFKNGNVSFSNTHITW